MKSTRVRFITKVAVLSAAAFILQLAGSLAGIKVGGFLDVELSDFPAVIGAFAMGPGAGVLIELIKNFLHLTVSSTGFVGELANFIINGLFVLVAGIIYRRNKTKRGAVVALVFGTLAMAVGAVLANMYILLPLYMPAAGFGEKLKIVLSVITPFNLVRGAVLSVLAVCVYKPLSPILHK